MLLLSQDTDSSDELTEVVAAETSPSVSGSPGVWMGVSGNAIPVPEVEPEDPVETNTSYRFRINYTEFMASTNTPLQKTLRIPAVHISRPTVAGVG